MYRNDSHLLGQFRLTISCLRSQSWT